jgi:hypothetical protein
MLMPSTKIFISPPSVKRYGQDSPAEEFARSNRIRGSSVPRPKGLHPRRNVQSAHFDPK